MGGGGGLWHLPPTSEVGGSNPQPSVGKFVGFFTDGWQFTLQYIDQLYVVVSSAHKTAHHDMTYAVLNVTLKPK